ncbi:hypothetical protein IWX50DRAFT_215214 [Phyllosticta citricarpa]
MTAQALTARSSFPLEKRRPAPPRPRLVSSLIFDIACLEKRYCGVFLTPVHNSRDGRDNFHLSTRNPIMHSASVAPPSFLDREKPVFLFNSSLPDVAPVSREPFLSPLLPPTQQEYVKDQVPFYRLELLPETDCDDCSINAIVPKEPSESRVFGSILRLKDVRFLSTQAMGQCVVIGAVKIAHALERARRLLSKRDFQERRRARKFVAAAAMPDNSIPVVATFELTPFEPPQQTPPAAALPDEEQQQDTDASWMSQSPAKRSTLVELFAGKRPPRRDSGMDLGFELADLHERVPPLDTQGD